MIFGSLLLAFLSFFCVVCYVIYCSHFIYEMFFVGIQTRHLSRLNILHCKHDIMELLVQFVHFLAGLLIILDLHDTFKRGQASRCSCLGVSLDLDAGIHGRILHCSSPTQGNSQLLKK